MMASMCLCATVDRAKPWFFEARVNGPDDWLNANNF